MLLVGRASYGVSEITGAIDDLLIYDRALSTSEVAALLLDPTPSGTASSTASASASLSFGASPSNTASSSESVSPTGTPSTTPVPSLGSGALLYLDPTSLGTGSECTGVVVDEWPNSALSSVFVHPLADDRNNHLSLFYDAVSQQCVARFSSTCTRYVTSGLNLVGAASTVVIWARIIGDARTVLSAPSLSLPWTLGWSYGQEDYFSDQSGWHTSAASNPSYTNPLWVMYTLTRDASDVSTLYRGGTALFSFQGYTNWGGFNELMLGGGNVQSNVDCSDVDVGALLVYNRALSSGEVQTLATQLTTKFSAPSVTPTPLQTASNSPTPSGTLSRWTSPSITPSSQLTTTASHTPGKTVSSSRTPSYTPNIADFPPQYMASVYAGNGNSITNFVGGVTAMSASINPVSVLVIPAGLLIAGRYNNRVLFVNDSNSIVTSVVGSGPTTYSNYNYNYYNNGDNGPATSATLSLPSCIVLDNAGNLLIAEEGAHRIRIVNSVTRIIQTFAGVGSQGFSGDSPQPATDASLAAPQGLTVDASSGVVYVADTNNNRVRVIDTTGIISTVAGSGASGMAIAEYDGDGGLAINANLATPVSVALASGMLYIVEQLHHRIRVVRLSTGIISMFAGGDAWSTGGFGGDGFAAANAQFSTPSAVAVDADGNVFIVDSNNNRIRVVRAVSKFVYTVAGFGYGCDNGGGNNLPALSTSLCWPVGIAIDSQGNLFVAESSRVRKYSPIPSGTPTHAASPQSSSSPTFNSVYTSVATPTPSTGTGGSTTGTGGSTTGGSTTGGSTTTGGTGTTYTYYPSPTFNSVYTSSIATYTSSTGTGGSGTTTGGTGATYTYSPPTYTGASPSYDPAYTPVGTYAATYTYSPPSTYSSATYSYNPPPTVQRRPRMTRRTPRALQRIHLPRAPTSAARTPPSLRRTPRYPLTTRRRPIVPRHRHTIQTVLRARLQQARTAVQQQPTVSRHTRGLPPPPTWIPRRPLFQVRPHPHLPPP